MTDRQLHRVFSAWWCWHVVVARVELCFRLSDSPTPNTPRPRDLPSGLQSDLRGSSLHELRLIRTVGGRCGLLFRFSPLVWRNEMVRESWTYILNSQSLGAVNFQYFNSINSSPMLKGVVIIWFTTYSSQFSFGHPLVGEKVKSGPGLSLDAVS